MTGNLPPPHPATPSLLNIKTYLVGIATHTQKTFTTSGRSLSFANNVLAINVLSRVHLFHNFLLVFAGQILPGL